jgi:hypothetical protein
LVDSDEVPPSSFNGLGNHIAVILTTVEDCDVPQLQTIATPQGVGNNRITNKKSLILKTLWSMMDVNGASFIIARHEPPRLP